MNVEFEIYEPRNIRSIALIRGDTLDYAFKYADRSAINSLFEQRGECDDILIVKHGLLTDTSYANIALWDGHEWITPASPLLAGTCRARLIKEGVLKEGTLTPSDLESHQKIRIFNAMMDLIIPRDQISILF